ncbi:MAG: DUF5685 family protein [Bacillota bacterium]|jgi:hypothetical protein|nr:DUF5685 family protein [Bacillota bacterium]
MFGYSRPQKLDLTLRENNHYRAHYCGMCGALKRLYGVKWRLATNFDTALIALLISAQRTEPLEFRRRYCPFGHALGFGVVVDDNIAVTIAAALTAVMIGLKIADAERDGTRGARLVRFFTSRDISRAEQEIFRHDDALIERLRACDAELVDLEDRWQSRGEQIYYDQLLLPTAQGLGEVLAFTAQFADESELAEHNEPLLRRLGQAAGRIIYTLDCLHDLQKDIKENQFNGLLAAGLVNSDGRIAGASAQKGLEYLIQRCKSEMEFCFRQLRLCRYRAILSNILFLGIIPKAERALEAVCPA